MNNTWQDINLPGLSGSSMEEKKSKFITGVEDSEPASEPVVEKEVRIISAEWIGGPNGFTFNEQCFVDVKTEYLKKTVRSKLTGNLFGIYNDEEIDIAQTVEGFIDDKTSTARMEIKKLWFVNNDYYDAWQKDNSAQCSYYLKNIRHSRGENTIDSPILKMPSSPEKIDADFIEIADVHFNLNCAIPCLDTKGELIKALSDSLIYAINNPGFFLIVEGHSDTSGDPQYNLDISKLRAQAIKAILVNDTSIWNDVVNRNGSGHKIEVRDYQTTLKSLFENHSWTCDPGNIDNCDGPATRKGVHNFQEEYNAKFSGNLDVDGLMGPKTWEAIMVVLRSITEEQFKAASGKTTLPTLNFGYKDGNGVYPCGESCPIENSGDSNYRSAKNRRVEIVFYRNGDATPAIAPAPGRKIGLDKDPVTEKPWNKKPVNISNVTPVVDSIEITSVPSQFAPSAETCKIKYKVEGKNVSPTDKGVLIIKDKAGKELLKKEDLTLDSTKESLFEWDGKDSSGAIVNIVNAPVDIQLSVKASPKITSSVKKVKIEIHSVAFTIPSIVDGDKIIMNNPDDAAEIDVLVKLKKADGSQATADIPLDVKFTFSEPGGANTTLVASYQYDPAPKNLGKGNNAASVFWKKHADCAANSTDGFKTGCTVSIITAKGSPDTGKAKVYFLPAGVGGDSYKIKASVTSPGDNTVLFSEDSQLFTIWRSVNFSSMYEMNGTNHVSANSTTANIAPTFAPAFVKYTAGAATAIAAANSVEYIGLWKNTATPQESWATLTTKLPAETPSAAEIADANYAGADPALILKRNQAQQAICAKAQLWVNRIDTARDTAMNKWLADSAIPANSIVGIKKYHPKYSTTADTNTTQWDLYGAGNTPAWLRVNAFSGNYTNVDPDRIWVNGGHWGGLSVGNGIFSVPDYVAGVIQKVVAHEAGHASKSFFKRDDFGPSLDHSASNAGIMYFDTSGGNSFSDREKKILRGVIP